jgi:hypothetical protein
LDCSWYGSDALVAGVFFVEIESYAIAIACCANSTSGNSMGLILDARGSLFLLQKVHSLWKAETVAQDQDAHSYVFFHLKICSDPRLAVSEALSKGLDSSKFVR